MPLTQSQIDTEINNLVNRFTGQRIGFPNGSYPGECTAPIVWLLTDLGIPVPPMFNDRADGWGLRFPSDLMPYFSPEGFQSGKAYPRGTLLMWDSPHIAIVLADTGGDNSVLCFEQNADPDGAPCGTHTRMLNTPTHTCTYALIPIVEAPAPPVPYTVEPIPQKTVQTTHATNRWNLGLQTFDQINANPLASVDANYQFPTTQIVHHQDGYSYYVDASYDQSLAAGINVLDCEDYVAPPVPYVPPAAPVQVKPATTIQLVATVPTYANAHDADVRNEAVSTGSFPAGTYYQFGTENGMLNIGLTNQAIVTVWVNPKDNIAPPPAPVTPEAPPKQVANPVASEPLKPSEVPIGTEDDTAWKGDYKSFHPDRSPDTYELLHDYTMTEYGGKRPPIKLTEGRHIPIPGTFPKNGVMFYRPRDYKNDVTFSWYYGIPLFDDNGNPMMTKVVEAPKPQRIADLWHLWRGDIKNYLGTNKVWDVLFNKKRSK